MVQTLRDFHLASRTSFWFMHLWRMCHSSRQACGRSIFCAWASVPVPCLLDERDRVSHDGEPRASPVIFRSPQWVHLQATIKCMHQRENTCQVGSLSILGFAFLHTTVESRRLHSISALAGVRKSCDPQYCQSQTARCVFRSPTGL